MDDYEDFPLPPQLGWMGDQPLLLASASQTRMAMLIDAEDSFSFFQLSLP